MRTIDIYLGKARYLLKNNQNDFVNYAEFENFILERTKSIDLDDVKKINILRQFWSKYNFSEGISTIVYKKFNDFSEKFKKIIFRKRFQFEQ